MGAVRDRLLSGRSREFAIAVAAGAAMLLASLANFLTHNSYPYFRPEIGLIVAAILAVTALMAAWYIPQRQWGRSFLEGLLAAIFVDLNTDAVWMIFVAGVGVAAITFWWRISLLGPMAVLGSVIFLTTIAGIGGRPAWINTIKGDAVEGGAAAAGKPAILHIILDEHLGLQGMAAEGPDGQKLQSELTEAYSRAGFAVFGRAYSQHYHSANSIPYILNYGRGLGEIVDRKGVKTGPTRHLQSLVDQGYRLRILQSDYADVCAGAQFFECTTYDSSSLRPTLDVKMGTDQRTELITYKFLKLSDIFTVVSEGWNFALLRTRGMGHELPYFNTSPGHSSTVASIEAFEKLVNQLSAAKPGDAYFAHLLFPHHPYVVGRDCKYVNRPWQGLRSGAALDVKRRAYFEQLRCAAKVVERGTQAFVSSAAGPNVAVIIHGDHGSRMTRRMTSFNQGSGDFEDEDLIAVYSTIFAVRSASIPPNYSGEPRPVATLLRDFTESGFTSPPASELPSKPQVYLTDHKWRIVGKLSLPAQFASRLDRPVKGQ